MSLPGFHSNMAHMTKEKQIVVLTEGHAGLSGHRHLTGLILMPFNISLDQSR